MILRNATYLLLVLLVLSMASTTNHAQESKDLGGGFMATPQYIDNKIFVFVTFPEQYLNEKEFDKGTILVISKLFTCSEFKKIEGGGGGCEIVFGGEGEFYGKQYRYIDTVALPAYRIAIFGLKDSDGYRIGIAVTIMAIPGLKT